jgi:hypothetical protein
MKKASLFLFILLSIYGCNKDVPCGDANVQMIFTSFPLSDLDTIVLRKYKLADNYQHLVDTINIFYDSSLYRQSNDTTFVSLADPMKGIKVHYDWQISIPAINRTVFISDITSEQGTIKCSNVLEPLGCFCTNKIYSLKKNSVLTNLSNQNPQMESYHIYIEK